MRNENPWTFLLCGLGIAIAGVVLLTTSAVIGWILVVLGILVMGVGHRVRMTRR